MAVNNSLNAPNAVIQKVISSTSTKITVDSGSNIPGDDTIPQNTEGGEVLTATITPTNAANKLIVTFIGNMLAGSRTGQIHTVAMFQDSTANAIAAVQSGRGSLATSLAYTATLRKELTAGTTSATTFKIRIGSDSSKAIYLDLNSCEYGGVVASSITITEYQA